MECALGRIMHRRLPAGRRSRSHHTGAGDPAQLPDLCRPAFRSAAGHHSLGGNGRTWQGFGPTPW